jgi:hypothetical protein
VSEPHAKSRFTRRPLALGPLRAIVEVLPSPQGYRPARVKLECGHEGLSWGRTRDDSGGRKHAHCWRCL